jgi:ankyrin repeat protein
MNRCLFKICLFAIGVSLFQFCSENRRPPAVEASPTKMLILKAATYNTENLFEAPMDSAIESEFENYVAKGAKVDSLDRDSNTALLLLSKTSKEQYFPKVTALARILLENKADLRITDPYQRNALHYACINGNKPLVELLVNNGADVNALDKSNCNSVAFAVLNGDRVEIVDFLIGHGAELTWKDSDGKMTLLDIAERRGHAKTADYLKAKTTSNKFSRKKANSLK